MFPWNKMFPFPKDYMKDSPIFKQSEVENMMNKAMKNNFQSGSPLMNSTDFFEQSFELLNKVQASKKKKKAGFQPNVFETHDEVFVRFPVENEQQLLSMNTYHTTTTCVIENIPNNGNKHTVNLPCVVKKVGSRASFKEGVLEIRIPKEQNIPITKIPIDYIKQKKRKNKN
ncbi:MAG: Hsp20/alpha crystallin family protein [Bacillaceae bacterium]|nr:Hsp20/alpha crystallin family protein [Bacillaceae bacterium]